MKHKGVEFASIKVELERDGFAFQALNIRTAVPCYRMSHTIASDGVGIVLAKTWDWLAIGDEYFDLD